MSQETQALARSLASTMTRALDDPQAEVPEPVEIGDESQFAIETPMGRFRITVFALPDD